MKKASDRADDDQDVPASAFARGVRGRHATRLSGNLNDLAKSLAGLPKMHVWAPLIRFAWEGSRLQLTPDIGIEATSPSDLLERKEAQEFLSVEERKEYGETRHWLHVVRPVQHELSPRSAVNMFLLALWIVRPTTTYIPVRFQLTESEFSVSRVLDRFQWIPGWTAEDIAEEDLHAARMILAVLHEVYLEARRLRNALTLTFRGCVSVDWQSAFICFMTAIEAILIDSTGRDSSERIAKAYGKITAGPKLGSKAGIERVKRMYAVRSNIVHGVASSSEQNLANLSDCSEVLRTLWRAVLGDSNLRNALERDDRTRRIFLAKQGLH